MPVCGGILFRTGLAAFGLSRRAADWDDAASYFGGCILGRMLLSGVARPRERKKIGKKQVTPENVTEVASRFSRLYTGAISDILDRNGYRNQVLPYYITPFTTANRVAGIAFTGQGYPCADITHDDTETRLKILDRISPGRCRCGPQAAARTAHIGAKSCPLQSSSADVPALSSTAACVTWIL